MYRIIPGLIAVTASCLLSANASAWGCRFAEDRSAVIDVNGARLVDIRVGAGDLEIRGVSGSDKIEIEGRACATRQDIVDDIRIATAQEGDLIRIGSDMGEVRDDDDWGALDLVIRLPQHLMLRVKDSSGAAYVGNVAALEIADSSGELTIENIAGPLSVQDSSGGIDIRAVAGGIVLTDSSGDIEIEEVDGDVLIQQDSSGDIEVRKVRGSVRVAIDSSGSIYARDVSGDFAVDTDSSGRIDYRDIGGTVSLPPGKEHH